MFSDVRALSVFLTWHRCRETKGHLDSASARWIELVCPCACLGGGIDFSGSKGVPGSWPTSHGLPHHQLTSLRYIGCGGHQCTFIQANRGQWVHSSEWHPFHRCRCKRALWVSYFPHSCLHVSHQLTALTILARCSVILGPSLLSSTLTESNLCQAW